MLFIRKIHSFGASRSEMVHLWITYCRSILEQSAVVWQGGLTDQNRQDLERTQKSFAKLILKNNYENYNNALKRLNIPTLESRRDLICLRFAKNCRNNNKMKHLFPLNSVKHNHSLRRTQKFHVHKANTERFEKSPIIYMQKLLNRDHNQTTK